MDIGRPGGNVPDSTGGGVVIVTIDGDKRRVSGPIEIVVEDGQLVVKRAGFTSKVILGEGDKVTIEPEK